ncbi:MFS transporter [Leekyejoonella antrihumi]|uniref:MFS transporter n=1 Tax=Leekyejoonella antrihumi TaxID=1660198 RepID=A0A563E8J7_9MICO|nr:MFS transporter [Leekyejoonella antrihumi]TWP38850.1 MFS transporter [Leekyejoonella antrihumi]
MSTRMRPPRAGHLGGRVLALLAIPLLALNLRSAITSIAPVLAPIQQQLHMSNTQASVLGALPPVIFGLAGIATPTVIRRLGADRAAALAMVLATLGMVVRALSPGAVFFFLPQFVALVGMGMGNVLLPPLVKRYFPDRIGALTVLYGIFLQLGTALPAFLAVPIADAGGWRTSLGGWAGLSLLAGWPWVLLSTGGSRSAHQDADADPSGYAVAAATGTRIAVRALLRNRLAWGATLLIGMTSLNTYPIFTWLPQILTDAGISRGDAGSLLGLYSLMSLPLALTIPWIAVKLRNPLVLVIAGLSCYLVGYAGLALAPSRAPLLWTVLCGLAATGFPLALALANLRTLTHEGAVALSGFMQGFGYLLAAAGPLVTGLLHSLTGTWQASFGFLGVTLVPLTIGGVLFCRPTALEDTLPPGPSEVTGTAATMR